MESAVINLPHMEMLFLLLDCPDPLQVVEKPPTPAAQSTLRQERIKYEKHNPDNQYTVNIYNTCYWIVGEIFHTYNNVWAMRDYTKILIDFLHIK